MAKLKGNGSSKGAGKINVSEHRQEDSQSYAITASDIRKLDQRKADALVDKFIKNKTLLESIGQSAFDSISKGEELQSLIHSVKFRVKDPEHLRDKLYRKCRKAKLTGTVFSVNESNLFQEINDLIGIRILHLYTAQIVQINTALQTVMARARYVLREGPIAKTWDDESRNFFTSVNIQFEESKTQYTSVHYVFDADNDFHATLEVQVRTLAEELWGEVDHRINYPHRHSALACTEQIAVLARVTSSCTRLVDSIFRTYEDLS